jgi:8-oxo-dGTP diphosphatase
VAQLDGDGWVDCDRGHRHWGRFGAAGLLVTTVGPDGRGQVLMQHRSPTSHHGDTWGLPGGARASDEDAITAALRETVEEAALDVAAVRPRAVHNVDHGGWQYQTVVADTPTPLATTPNVESLALRWVDVERVGQLPLHPGFAAAWPDLAPEPTTVVVDAANVVGSDPFRLVPDGWWRDRAGAAERLLDELTALPPRLLWSADRRPRLVTDLVVVLEGRARAARTQSSPRLKVVATDGSGDDAIVAVTATTPPRPSSATVVVTADRGLRERLPRWVEPVGPGWLWAELDRHPLRGA